MVTPGRSSCPSRRLFDTSSLGAGKYLRLTKRGSGRTGREPVTGRAHRVGSVSPGQTAAKWQVGHQDRLVPTELRRPTTMSRQALSHIRGSGFPSPYLVSLIDCASWVDNAAPLVGLGFC